ncbi:hypothetical protein F2Q68_00016563 [Brassica cretica]|uniref:Brix domain-containing protein n=1 Tax=Brassica cretica TaxID=69181 RepID=A0A8S9HC96_BRACR|nr:hypothetical protein F2Q68_00016563 [Brassica cretica]
MLLIRRKKDRLLEDTCYRFMISPPNPSPTSRNSPTSPRRRHGLGGLPRRENLITNQLMKDLNSSNEYEVSLALECLARIGTDDLARDLTSEVFHIVLASIEPRLAKKVADPISLKLAVAKIKEFLVDDDPNLKYLGLHALSIVAPKHLWAVLENKEAVRGPGFISELQSMIPNSDYRKRGTYDLKKIVEYAKKKEYTSLIVVHTNRREPDTLLIIGLPNGPAAHFKLSNLVLRKDIKLSNLVLRKDIKNHGNPTSHEQELVLNNFTTRLGNRVGRFFQSLFPQEPNFRGRRVVRSTTSVNLYFADTIDKQSGAKGKEGVAKERVKDALLIDPALLASAQGIPDPSSDVRDSRAAPARDLFFVRDSIRKLTSDDQSVPDQATKDIRDPIEATRSITARVPFVSSSRLNSFGGPIQQSSKVKR